MERSFVASGYHGLTKDYPVEQAGKIFDKTIAGLTRAMHSGLADPGVYEEAKALFEKKFRDWGDAEGLMREIEGFYTVVGLRVQQLRYAKAQRHRYDLC